MTKKEMAEAKTIAESRDDLSNHDVEILHGVGLREFKPVRVDIRVVARMMRDYRQFNGAWDNEALNELCSALRYKVQII